MKASKTTILDYVDWRGDLEFSRDKLNEVDCLIFSSLAYLEFESVPFVTTAIVSSAPTLEQVYGYVKNVKCYGRMFLPLCQKCATSARFKNTKVMFYKSVVDEVEQTQFSAVTFVLESSEAVIAFRGTDDTLVGWQEDFNMAVGTIPGHKYARRYICDIADALGDRKLYVAGHSKGGNLAVWASAHLYDIHFERLQKVYDFDGPGFYGDFTDSDEYKKITCKTTKYVVDASIIGMLLSSNTPQVVIDSTKHISILQHLTTTWCVSGNKLCRLRQRSDRGINSQAIVEELIESLTFEERKQFVVMLADIVHSSNIKSFSELGNVEAIPKIFDMIKKSAVKDEDKQLVSDVWKRFTTILKNRTINITGLKRLNGE